MSVAGKGLLVSRGDIPAVAPENLGMLCFQETNRAGDGACHKTDAHTVNSETRKTEPEQPAEGRERKLSLEEARKERQALRWMITVQLRGDAGAQRLTAWLPMHLVVISLNGAQIITNIFSCK